MAFTLKNLNTINLLASKFKRGKLLGQLLVRMFKEKAISISEQTKNCITVVFTMENVY